MVKFVPFYLGVGHLKVEKRIYVGEMRINLHSTATDRCIFFHFIVNENENIKQKAARDF